MAPRRKGRSEMLAMTCILVLNFVILTKEKLIHAFVLLPMAKRPISSSTCRRHYELLDKKKNNNDDWRETGRTDTSSSRVAVPQSHVRWMPRSSRGIGASQTFDLQTCITTLKNVKTGQRVDLHAMLHYAMPQYYQYYHSQLFQSTYKNNNTTNVFYELLLDQSLLESLQQSQQQHIQNNYDSHQLKPSSKEKKSLLQASPKDQALAKSYGLVCQVDAMNYERNAATWQHADLTRQQLLQLVQQEKQQQKQTPNNQQPLALLKENFERLLEPQNNQQQPLWIAASTAAQKTPAQPILHAFSRPLATSTSSVYGDALFSNLFLSGQSLSTWFRYLTWFCLPTPELSVLLLDWSTTTTPTTTTPLQKNILAPRNQQRQSESSLLQLPRLSPTVLPILQSLGTGNLQQARQLLFGQLIVQAAAAAADTDFTTKRDFQGNNNNLHDDEPWLITARNQHALQLLQQTMARQTQTQLLQNKNAVDINNNNDDKNDRMALLYGLQHCPGLMKQLLQTGDYVVESTTWRTAWSVKVPLLSLTGQPIATATTLSPLAVGIGLVLIPLYLLLGGLDWMETVQSLASAFTNNGDGGAILDSGLTILFYMLRHILLYVGLLKFVVEQQQQSYD